MVRDTIKSLAREIQLRWPELHVLVERGHCNTDRKVGRFRHPGRGRWGARIIVRDKRGELLLDHNNAETYRNTSEVRRWMESRCASGIKHEHVVVGGRCSCGLDFNCVVCGVETRDFYMLEDEVWFAALGKRSKRGNMHLKCVEVRLGRKLLWADFNSAACNKSPCCDHVEGHMRGEAHG